jgi:uncharacterized protein YbbC (DUF1343 family)/beta-glucosidase-like glycosyl hydrolase
MKKLFACILLCFFITAKPFDIGQRFILSLPQNTDDRKFLYSWLEQTKPAGVMLWAHHCANREKTKELISFLQETAKKLALPPFIITVDWEGGIVSRPNETGGFVSVPSPWSLAQAGRDSCYKAGLVIGKQMHDIGANMDFAPSVDLFDIDNQILATRCFSSDPAKVSESGIAFCKGLMNQGVLPVIKHFPGLGLGKNDTHQKTVAIQADDQLLKKHMSPFIDTLNAGIPCIMSSHAIFKQFGDDPITLSPKAISFLKKHTRGALFITDDFAMDAISANYNMVDAFMKSLNAGYHLIIFSGLSVEQAGFTDKSQAQIHSIQNLQKQFDMLTEEQQQAIEQGAAEIENFKAMYISKKPLGPAIFDENIVSQELAKRCIQTTDPLPVMANKRIVMFSVDLGKIRAAENWFIKNKHSFLYQEIAQDYKSIDEYILNPLSSDSIDTISDLVESYQDEDNITFIVQTFFYADNKWNRIQREWLNSLKTVGKNLIIISLGHPLEKSIIPQAHCINLGSFQEPLLRGAATLLAPRQSKVGADILLASPKQYLQNKHIGLLCHRGSNITFKGKQYFLPDIIKQWVDIQHDNTQLTALFCPEHGLRGTEQAGSTIKSDNQSEWGCPVYSLYGKNKKPSERMLKNIDLMIIDLQEIGVRCFTYLSSMKKTIEAAAEQNIPVLILDRPNPIEFWGNTGPMLVDGSRSFVGELDVRFLHGTSMGKLAQKINKTYHGSVNVIECQNCSDDYFFSHPIVPPSPNLSSIDHIYSYPLTVFLEGTNYSEGRGTTYPFLQIGAPWVNARELATTLNNHKLPGIYFESTFFTPHKIAGVADSPKHQDQLCGGVFIHILDRKKVAPIKTAMIIIESLFILYPQQSELTKSGDRYFLDLLVGNASWREKLITTCKE